MVSVSTDFFKDRQLFINCPLKKSKEMPQVRLNNKNYNHPINYRVTDDTYTFTLPKEVMFMCRGKELTDIERYYIEKCFKRGMKSKEIAELLGRSRQCIDYELKKGIVKQLDYNLKEIHVYKAEYAINKSLKLKSCTGRKVKFEKDESILMDIEKSIKNGVSVYVALKELNLEGVLCEKTVYNYFHKNHFNNLRYTDFPFMTNGKRRYHKKEGKLVLDYVHSIEKRESFIEKRADYGHWEMDTVYSGKKGSGCLLVLTERKTRLEIILPMKDRTSQSVAKAISKIERNMGLGVFRETFKTITCDNGVEFKDYNTLERGRWSERPRTKLYYCHPYSSFERGSNENQNRLIRRFIPKGDDISLYSIEEIREISSWMNKYPRKLFKGKSSYDKLCIEYIHGNISQKCFDNLRKLVI